MSDEHKRSTPGERPRPLAEVLDRVGDAFRAAGIHPYYVVIPGEAPGEQHVAVCMDAYARPRACTARGRRRRERLRRTPRPDGGALGGSP